jgi:cytochrome b
MNTFEQHDERLQAVWDLPVRIGHWLLAGSVLTALLTGESESWRLVHLGAGALAVAVVLFRLVWGFCGTAPARFASFVTGPRQVWAYLQTLLANRPQHHTGHNPAGAWAIVGLLTLVLLTGLSGAAAYWEWWGAGDLFGEIHEGLSSGVILLVGVHLLGVLVGSWSHHENLVRAMLTGYKRGNPGEGRQSNAPLAAVVLVLLALWSTWFAIAYAG